MATPKFTVASVGTSAKPDLEGARARALGAVFSGLSLPEAAKFVVNEPRGVGKVIVW